MRPLTFIPNTVTFLRIAGTAALWFLTPFSLPFYAVYTFCGLTDVLDGTLARVLKCGSEFGAKLDSAADLLFYGVMIVKLIPFLTELLPPALWMTVFATFLLRVVSYITAAVKYKRFSSMHTYLNKFSGAATFTVPYFVTSFIALPVCAAVTAAAVIAAIEEFAIHLTLKEYRGDIKTLVDILR